MQRDHSEILPLTVSFLKVCLGVTKINLTHKLLVSVLSHSWDFQKYQPAHPLKEDGNFGEL